MTREVVIDGRDLQPPEPMERVLDALDLLQDGERVRLLIHCIPLPLYDILDRLGYRHSLQMLADGSYEVLIERA